MLDLRKTEQTILANGGVDNPELTELPRQMYGGGKIQRRGTASLADPAESAEAAGLR